MRELLQIDISGTAAAMQSAIIGWGPDSNWCSAHKLLDTIVSKDFSMPT